MKDILLVGGGGHCKAVIDVILGEGKWRIAGIVERRGSPVEDVLGYPVVGYDDDLPALAARFSHAVVTVGQIKSAAIRCGLYQQLLASGFVLPTVVSRLAHVAQSARLAPGVMVMNFAHIGPDCVIGANTIINTRALVEHDAIVGEHCHVATAAVMNGGAQLGARSLLGSGSICREGVHIGEECVIGMGVIVRKPVPANQVFFGRN